MNDHSRTIDPFTAGQDSPSIEARAKRLCRGCCRSAQTPCPRPTCRCPAMRGQAWSGFICRIFPSLMGHVVQVPQFHFALSHKRDKIIAKGIGVGHDVRAAEGHRMSCLSTPETRRRKLTAEILERPEVFPEALPAERPCAWCLVLQTSFHSGARLWILNRL